MYWKIKYLVLAVDFGTRQNEYLQNDIGIMIAMDVSILSKTEQIFQYFTINYELSYLLILFNNTIAFNVL